MQLLLCLFAVLVAWARGNHKVVLVTGSSTGIGHAVSLDFANQQGMFKVYATMRTPDKASDELRNNENVMVLPLDVTSEDSIKEAVDEIIKQEGRIDIVVNNAGYGMAGTVEHVTVPEMEKLFDVNVFGVVRVLQAVLPHMRKQRSGHVINISSTSGVRGLPGMEFYAGSKFALEGISDAMRYTLAAFNVVVTNVNAGVVKTRFTDRFGKGGEAGGLGSRQVEDPTGYVDFITQRAISSLNERFESKEAVDPDTVGMIVVNVAKIGLERRHVVDVPFNVGTNRQSMAILEHLRHHPTGWGGMYTGLLERMPSIKDVPKEAKTSGSEEL